MSLYGSYNFPQNLAQGMPGFCFGDGSHGDLYATGVVVVYYRNTLGSGVGTLSAAGSAAGTSGNGGQAGTNGVTASFKI